MRGEGGVAGEGRVVGVPKFHSWDKSVYKDGDPKLVSNYRPISLLSIPSKLLERIIHNKLMNHLLSNSIISRQQFGF